MEITLGNKKYICNIAAVSVFRYRLKYNRNIGDDLKKDFFRAALSLIYISIENADKPSFDEFVKLIRKIPDYENIITNIVNEFFKSDKKIENVENDNEDVDDLDLLALFGDSNFPEIMLYEASISQLSYLLNRYNKIKSGNYVKSATNNEKKKEYGITPDKGKKILDYIRKKRGEIIGK